MMVDISSIKAFQSLIQSSQKVILSTHKNPDGDGLGAMCALAYFLDQIGIESVLVSCNGDLEKYSFLDKAQSFVLLDDAVLLDADMIIVCDAGDIQHAGLNEIFFRLSKNIPVVNLDHHTSNTAFGDVNIIDPNVSSTCEVVYCIVNTMNAEITPQMATAMLLGIMVDTGNFSNPSTNSSSFEVAATLLEKGANMKEIVRAEFNNQTVSSLRIWGKALERLHVHKGSSIITTYLLCEDFSNNATSRVDGISNFLNNIPNADAILLLKEEQKGIIKGSLRTTNTCDVSKIAQFFGGGGHKKSAGFILKGNLLVENGRVTVI